MTQSIEHRGGRISFRVRGGGAPVVLIQGVGVHGDGWLPQVDALRSRFTCLTIDNRGMGGSEAPPSNVPLTVESMADDCRAVMTHLDWLNAHVVGHSLGGAVAQQLAVTSPAMVSSLSLLCTFASGRDAAPMTLRMIHLGMRSRVGTRRMRRAGFLRLVMSRRGFAACDVETTAARLEPLFGHDLADQPPIVDRQLKALRQFDLADQLPALANITTLVVSAAEDPIAPPSGGQRLANAIPGARHVELPDASHGVPLEQPDRVNQLLLDHLTAASR